MKKLALRAVLNNSAYMAIIPVDIIAPQCYSAGDIVVGFLTENILLKHDKLLASAILTRNSRVILFLKTLLFNMKRQYKHEICAD